jgi:hypothetical protein
MSFKAFGRQSRPAGWLRTAPGPVPAAVRRGVTALLAVAVVCATLGALPTYAAAPSLSRNSPTQSTVTVLVGASITFKANGADADGNLSGAEWYGPGCSSACVQHVIDVGGTGASAIFSRTWAFNTVGTFTITVNAFDTLSVYSPTNVSWTVNVQQNTAPNLTRQSPNQPAATVLVGRDLAFRADATDVNGNLSGVEWYGPGCNACVQHVADVGGTGNSAAFTWTWTFGSLGTYTIRAKAFDTLSAYSNEVSWTITVVQDTTPPIPNPMTFSTTPYADSSTSVRMRATQATDDWYMVEYYFFCALNSGGGGDYGFTPNRDYVDTGLAVNARYGYAVLARDTSPSHNATSYSATSYVYTLANIPGSPTVGGAAGNSLNVAVQPNGNPSATTFAIHNDTGGYYLSAAGGNGGSTPTWRTASQWGTVVAGGLAPNTPYAFSVQARNGDGLATAFGPAGSGTTLDVNYAPVASRDSPKSASPTFMQTTGGTTVRFAVGATDVNGNLRGVEWYVDGQHQVSHFGLSGSTGTDTWTHTFASVGTYFVEATVFDTQNAYSSSPATWTVQVSPRIRGMYVSDLGDGVVPVLGNPAAENSILEYARQNSLTYLALYLGNKPDLLDHRLDELIQRARAGFGVQQVGFVGGGDLDFDRYVAFNDSHVGKADVLNLEFEYWRPEAAPCTPPERSACFEEFKRRLRHMATVGDPRGLMVEAYVGWPTPSEIVEIAGLVDRLLVHHYVPDPAAAWGYGRERVLAAADALERLTLWPIFSTESTSSYSDQPFMGDWLAAHSLGEAEDVFMGSYADESDPRKYEVGVSGFQYFTSHHMTPLLFLGATGYSPPHAAGGIGLTDNLMITFNATVVKGTGGDITIRRVSDGITVETIPVADARVVTSGNQAVINHSTVLAPGTEYDVFVDGTCFRSSAGKYFPGISVPGSWRFTTASPTEPPALIFEDDFETGDLSRWSTTVRSGGDLAVSASAAMAGTALGLRIMVGAVAPVYVEDESPSNEDRYLARFYLHPNGFDPGQSEGHFRTRVLILFGEAPQRRLATLVLKRKGGEYYLLGRCRRSDDSQADTTPIPITDAPHMIEIEWLRATSLDAHDGRFALFVDGASAAVLSGLDNDRGSVDFVRLGTMGVKAGAGGAPSFDEFVSRRRDHIGP